MAEYIEREALLKRLACSPLFSNIRDGVLDLVEKQPTADVVEVQHGAWRFVGADRWNDTYECSVCGKMGMDDSAYCPNCGADMRGEKNGT